MEPWEEIDAFLIARGCKVGPPTVGQTTGGSHVAGSLHYQGRARDYGDFDSDPLCVWEALLPLAQGPDYVIEELFYDPRGGWDSGVSVGPIGNHDDHTHAALRTGAHLDAAGGGTGAAQAGGIPNPLDVFGGAGEAFGSGVGAVKDWIAELPAAFIEALLGGHSIVEVLIRTLELFGGAAILAAGVIMFLRVLKRTELGKAATAARSAGKRAARPVRQVVRRG